MEMCSTPETPPIRPVLKEINANENVSIFNQIASILLLFFLWNFFLLFVFVKKCMEGEFKTPIVPPNSVHLPETHQFTVADDEFSSPGCEFYFDFFIIFVIFVIFISINLCKLTTASCLFLTHAVASDDDKVVLVYFDIQ